MLPRHSRPFRSTRLVARARRPRDDVCVTKSHRERLLVRACPDRGSRPPDRHRSHLDAAAAVRCCRRPFTATPGLGLESRPVFQTAQFQTVHTWASHPVSMRSVVNEGYDAEIRSLTSHTPGPGTARSSGTGRRCGRPDRGDLSRARRTGETNAATAGASGRIADDASPLGRSVGWERQARAS